MDTTPRYKDPNLSIEERVADLLSRMTLEEKVRQMDMYIGRNFLKQPLKNPHLVTDEDEIDWDVVEETIGDLGLGSIHDLYATPKINNQLQKYVMERTRLGIPILFSEEGLHGYARPGSTIFPQSITMASTWNPEIVEKVGQALAAETRSFNVHEIFGPVIDLARDPRWGRMEETYGEDTYLSSRMAVAMVKGMQGDDLTSETSIVAEPKHFAGYGIPTGGLNCAPALIGKRDLYTNHLPIFEAAIKEGGALNVMCSYNSIDGIPTSGDYELLTEVLRHKWGMKGFVRADLGALGNLYHWHRVCPSREEAIKQSIEAGLDMQYYDYPHDFFQNALIKMVQSGEMKMETIDQAVSRILRVKFMLGLFERPYVEDENKWKTVVRCPEHQEIALEAARQGLVLLKNDGGLLPLDKNISSIAVIGPSADTPRLGGYSSSPYGFEPVTVLEGIKRLVSDSTVVRHVVGVEISGVELKAIPNHWLKTSHGEPGLFGQYFDNPNFEGEPLERVDRQIDFNWIATKPFHQLGNTHYTVRWTGKLVPTENLTGFLGIATYDSMRVWIDGELIIDGWGDVERGGAKVEFTFEAGREYDLKVEYCKDGGGARVLLGWSQPIDEIAEAVEAARQSDVAVVCLGDSNETCGEGVDRVELGLPGRQLELLQAVYETGTPVVLVLQNGRAMTLTWEAEHVPAIIEAWYGGEQGGLAIAEAIFGDINPGGRLPVSFPKAVGQLPIYYNRQPGGRITYVEMDWEPLFPFGYGLSYTEFRYSNLQLSPTTIESNYPVRVSVDVTNIGERTGDEVVQLYIRDLWSSVVRPHKELKRFKRVTINPGETQTITFELNADDFKLFNREYQWVVEPGEFDIMVGPHANALDLRARIEITEGVVIDG